MYSFVFQRMDKSYGKNQYTFNFWENDTNNLDGFDIKYKKLAKTICEL